MHMVHSMCWRAKGAAVECLPGGVPGAAGKAATLVMAVQMRHSSCSPHRCSEQLRTCWLSLWLHPVWHLGSEALRQAVQAGVRLAQQGRQPCILGLHVFVASMITCMVT